MSLTSVVPRCTAQMELTQIYGGFSTQLRAQGTGLLILYFTLLDKSKEVKCVCVCVVPTRHFTRKLLTDFYETLYVR